MLKFKKTVGDSEIISGVLEFKWDMRSAKKLQYESRDVQTPLGIATMNICKDKVVLGTILRAGLPMHEGLLETFDGAENAIISAYRKHDSDISFKIEVEYMSSPSLENKVLILCDPMLATGMSMVSCWKILTEKKRNAPEYTYCFGHRQRRWTYLYQTSFTT